ncbi:unnamed protein product [Effrenium voratum]|uniref:Sphingomyelin synthase-like domain-containing protein n=1 Tax=Effrenium voratum TaxID=2562239 RepID=A0AA36HM39_9DINO|nr:unnamed protein product [Effrenium voratum]
MAAMYGASDASGRYTGFASAPFCLRDFRREELLKFGPRVGAACAICLAGIYVNNLSQAWLQQNMATYYQKGWKPVPPMSGTVKLWDVSFHFLPYVKLTFLPDIFAGVCQVTAVIRFLVVPGPMSLRWIVLSRYLIIWGLLWFCRAVTIVSTPLPNPDHTCVPRITFPDNVFLEAWANLPIVPWYNEMTCQDVLFSGHTVCMTLPMLTMFKYVRLAPWFPSSSSNRWWSTSTAVNICGTFVLCFGYFFIVATHFHYTVDVIMGAVLSLLVFNYYHYAAKVATLSRRPSRLCIIPFLRWFEKHSKDLHHWRQRASPGLLQVEAEEEF